MSLVNSIRGKLAMFALAAVPALPSNEPIRVTRSDVEWSNEKVSMAYGALADMWTKEFQSVGERFVVPRVVRYRGNALTACGMISANNAQYCQANNAIYYDEVFVAGMAKIAAENLRTDGDMTGIGIIAHEMGHAVAMQLGYRSRNSYENEKTADCLAGAFAHQAERDKSLEPGDEEEAIFGMSMAGDPEVNSTGDARYDRLVQMRMQRQAHGTRDQRVANFREGFSRGPAACLPDFR
jgi:predicted metalloprotease